MYQFRGYFKELGIYLNFFMTFRHEGLGGMGSPFSLGPFFPSGEFIVMQINEKAEGVLVKI